MKTFIQNAAIILLFFVGIAAIIGGWSLVIDPSGSAMELSLNLLQKTPFQNYFYPGLILLIANGFGCVITGSMAIIKAKSYPVLILIQGFILIGWIVIQIALIGDLNWLQKLMAAIGTLLVLAGILLYEWQHHVKAIGKPQIS